MTKSRNSTFRLRYVQGWVDRDGRAHLYFRRAGFPRVRLPGLIGSAEFMEAYKAALGSAPEPVGAGRSRPGSVAAAIASYYGSAAFKNIAPDTQGVRRAVLDAFAREHGDKLMRAMPSKFIRALLDAMEPTTAKNWLAAIRALAKHCIERELIENDPTVGIKLGLKAGDGFHCWTEEQIAQFESHHPIGSRERLAFALGLYTAQRRGDVVRMGRQHLRDCQNEKLRALGFRSILALRQQKTGTSVAIPVHPQLQAMLDAAPAGQMTFLMTLRGGPFTPHAFTPWFGEACDAAGLPSACTFHGLRKSAAVRLADAGCKPHQIMAITGHTTLKEVTRYTEAFNRANAAGEAMARTMVAEKKREAS